MDQPKQSPSPPLPPPPPNDDEDVADEEVELIDISWEVDEVIDKRTNPDTGNTEYQLKWRNWDGSPTWEPELHCDCKELIDSFERKLARLTAAAAASTQPRPRRGRKPKAKSRTPGLSSSQPATYMVQSSPVPSTSSPSTSSSASFSQMPVSANSSQTERRRSTRVQELYSRRIIDEITISDSSDSDLGLHSLPLSPFQSTPVVKPKAKRQVNYRPRSRSIARRAATQVKTSSSDEERNDEDNDPDLDRIIRRKLIIHEIIGIVKQPEIYAIIKWKGIKNLEKVPLNVLRKYYASDFMDFLVQKIKWIE